MEETWARATANAFGDGHYVNVPGNHITMLFTDGAVAMAREIAVFEQSSSASVSERRISCPCLEAGLSRRYNRSSARLRSQRMTARRPTKSLS